MKQCKPNPWEEFSSKHEKNDRTTGVIKSITDFGIFIGLEGGIDGLVHLSDLAWDDVGEDAVRNYKKGDEIEAVVLAVDAERGYPWGQTTRSRSPFNLCCAKPERYSGHRKCG